MSDSESCSIDLLAEFRSWYADWLKRRLPLESWHETYTELGLATGDIDEQLRLLDDEYTQKWGKTPSSNDSITSGAAVP